MTKKNIMPVVVLTVICIVVAALLSVVNMLTAPIIKENAERKVQESLYEVFPDADGFDKIDLAGISGKPGTVTEAYADRAGGGYVVVVQTSTSYTSGEKMSVSIGINNDLKIIGIKLNAYSETKDFGKESYPKKFVGLGSEDINLNDDELLVSGVTYSSKAFKSAVKDALNFVTVLGGGSVEIPLADRVAALLPGAVELPLPTDAEATVKAIYSGVGGHAVHAKNESAEIVAAISNDGKTLGVDIISDTEGAGENSVAVKALVTDAAEAAGARIAAIAAKISSTKVVEIDAPDAPDTVNRLFIGEGGYVVETITATQYVARETQALVAIDRSGVILSVELINWTVGHDVYPEENYTDAYVGKTEGTVDGVELVAGATGTAEHLRDSVKGAVSYIGATLKAAAEQLGVQSVSEVVLEGAPATVKRVFASAGAGYVVEVATSTKYVAVETHARVAIGTDGKVASVKLLKWVVGHDVYPEENYADSYNGKDMVSVGGVELVSGATGTAEHLRDAVKDAIVFVTTPEQKAVALLPDTSSVEKLVISDMPEVVKGVYRGNGGFVAEVATSTQYVPVEIHAFVAVDNAGNIMSVELLEWVVGHGVYPPENYTDAYVGKTEGTVDGVELITEATYTSEHLRDAVKAALTVIKGVM